MEQAVEALIAYKGLVVGVWLALFFAGERLAPAARSPELANGAGWARLGRNAALWLINTALSPLIVVPLTVWSAARGLPWRPAWWQGLPGVVGDLILLDLLIYWWHRFNHEVPFLWRFHEVHHLDRFLDSTTALRFHFGEVLLSATARAVVILVLGFPLLSVLVFEAVLLCATIFHHSNLRLPAGLERALSRLVVTPSIHWVHHHARAADLNSNYATLLSLWDPLFATRSATRRTLDMTLGVAGENERPLLTLLWRPFGRRPFATSGR